MESKIVSNGSGYRKWKNKEIRKDIDIDGRGCNGIKELN